MTSRRRAGASLVAGLVLGVIGCGGRGDATVSASAAADLQPRVQEIRALAAAGQPVLVDMKLTELRTEVDALHDAMSSVVARAPLEEQLSLLQAHPELGARTKMSQSSAAEQAGAGFSALTGDEADRFRSLNAAYRDKFGFPFLYAVKGRTAHDIVNALERRLTSARDAEHQEALRQVYRIARFRLEDMIS